MEQPMRIELTNNVCKPNEQNIARIRGVRWSP